MDLIFFYSSEDFLVFYTIFSTYAQRYSVCILGLCLMIDHVHVLISSDSIKSMGCFISAYTSEYVREFNTNSGRKGQLFKHHYGSAVKYEHKKIRSAIAYLFNNPVEKRLCDRAERYRWNFLAYYDCGFPFSPILKKCSRRLERSKKIVREMFNKGKSLSYPILKNIFYRLDRDEKAYLADYIIFTYFPFDRKGLEKFYKSHEDMLIAINSNTGSEYELVEKHYCKTDIAYREIISYLHNSGIQNPQSVIMLTEREKWSLFAKIKASTSATGSQIKKFLHLI